MNDMLLWTVKYQHDYWLGMLAFSERAILGHTSEGDPIYHEAKLMVSFCREMLSTCVRWLEQIGPEATE